MTFLDFYAIFWKVQGESVNLYDIDRAWFELYDRIQKLDSDKVHLIKTRQGYKIIYEETRKSNTRNK